MLSFIFSIQGFALSNLGLIIAFLIGAIIAYFTNTSAKTLYRVPYFFMFACAFLVYVLLSYLINFILFKLNGRLPITAMALFSAVAPFLFGYVAMYLSVLRARDGFGKKVAAWLLIVPLLNLGLFIVTLDDDPEDNEKPINRDPLRTPAFMNGVISVVSATIIFALSFTIGMMVITYPSFNIVPEPQHIGSH